MPVSAEASCLRCDTTLRRTRSGSFSTTLALSVTSLVLYLIAVNSPFLFVDIVGRQRQTTMLSLPGALWSEGSWELALVVTATAIVAPLIKIAVVLTVLGGLQTANPPRFLPGLFKWYERIGPWAMVEVFLLGVFVAFTRLGSIATVEVGIALYAIAGLMITMITADATLDPEEVWEEMEDRGLVGRPAPLPADAHRIGCTTCGCVNAAAEGTPCLRCGSPLMVRLSNSFANTWAFLAAGTLLYIPANIFPILTLTRLGSGSPSTILGGAQELLDAGMWPLALLVFVASITVPLLKLVSLILMLVTAHRHSAWHLRDRTRLFRFVDFIGRWSMIDVFMLATLVGLVRAGNIASIVPGLGAICFASVVVLTMLAVICFDPRLMWDAVSEEERAVRTPTHAGQVPGAKPA